MSFIVKGAALLCGALLTAIFAICMTATYTVAEVRTTTIVGNDRGGLIGARAIEIEAINAAAGRVELRGRICHSSCTMYLAVNDLCVSATTTFGFHGPSRNGTALPQSQFDHWSAVMARHYDTSLGNWFMREARHRTNGYYRITGAQLIARGYPACQALGH